MNFRTAFFTLFALGLFLALCAGQQKEELPASPQRVGFASDSAGAVAPRDHKPSDLRILFTGYLLGYYRVPYIQPGDFQSDCPNNLALGSPPVEKFHEAITKQENPDHTILVGMGDNFAVQLYSRVYAPDPPASDSSIPTLIPKPRNSPDPKWKSPSGRIGDNVGCFLALAHYDAIVPGKEDFYFGAERLRNIANALAHVPDRNNAKPGDGRPLPVHILADNLVVQTTFLNAPTQIPDSEKSLKFIPGLPDGIQVSEISDHGTVLPFLQSITVKSGLGSKGPKLTLCVAGGDPDEYTCSGKIDLIEEADSKPTLPNSLHRYKLDPPLQAGSNYQLCADPANQTKAIDARKPRCIRFNVAKPYLNGDSSNPPYRYIPEKNVVIYGVVDPAIQSLVGRDNLSWKNVDKELTTEVLALDPLKSLKQAEQLFEKSKEGAGKKPRKILLAQMSRANAEELAESLDFDLVIAAARPYEHATTNRVVTMEKDPVSRKYRGIVVVPWQPPISPSEKEDKRIIGTDKDKQPTLFDPLRQLDSWDKVSDGQREVRVWKLSGDRNPVLSESECSGNELNRAAAAQMRWQVTADQYGSDSPPCKKPTADDAFVKLVLKTLREKAHADLGMLQRRDFYYGPFLPPTLPPQPGQGAIAVDIEKTLWTGDISRVVLVTGDTLKKVLKESEALDRRDIDATAEKLETGQGLFTFGIGKTEDGQYMVDGDLLDPKRLYSIATSNHITAGDTGYPELSDPQLSSKSLPNPSHVAPDTPIKISEIVCHEMKEPGCIVAPDLSYPEKDGNSLFASSVDRPSQGNPTPALRAKSWAIHSWDRPTLGSSQSLVATDSAKLETQTQDRGIWRFSLVQGSFSFQESMNNMSEATRAKLFTGNAAPGLNGANSHQWQLSKLAEAVRGGRWLDEYVRNQIDYSSQVTEQAAPALPSVSQSKNRDQFDAGLFFHPITLCPHWLFVPCWNQQKEYPKIGLVLEPFRLDSPLARQDIIIGPRSNEEAVHMGRTQNLLARTGMRIENQKSHFETGYEAGWERGALVTFLAGPISCAPLPNQSPEGCLISVVPPVHVDQVRQTRDLRAFYVDYAWTTPLPWHSIKNVVQLQGEWFPFDASNENSSDTRKLYDINEKLSIPIFSSLSFQPGAEYYLYRNKFGVSELKRWTPSASLTWSFDRYSGGKWFKSLGYSPNATPAAAPK